MQKLTPLALGALMSLSVGAHAADPQKVSRLLAPWKDVSHCLSDGVGKVVSAKSAMIGGKPGVRVVSKPDDGGKLQQTGIQDLKPSDFPVGSAFCKLDLGAHD